MTSPRPNILFFHVDNLGFGELSCYSGAPLRGATTSRIDAFAKEGFRQTNRDPVSRMMEMKRGDRDPTEREQLTLDVRRDCDQEYLRRADTFIRRSVNAGAS